MERKLLVKSTLAALILCISFSFAGVGQSTNTKLLAAITSANNKFVDLFSQGSDLSVLYASDATLCPPNSDFVRGADGIRDFWKGAFNAGIKKVKLETVDVNSFGNFAQETGKYMLFGADDKMIDGGKYVVVWKKE